jgi:hypothetical protein
MQKTTDDDDVVVTSTTSTEKITNLHQQLIQLGIDSSTATEYANKLVMKGISSIEQINLQILRDVDITAKLHVKLLLQQEREQLDVIPPISTTTTSAIKKVAPASSCLGMNPPIPFKTCSDKKSTNVMCLCFLGGEYDRLAVGTASGYCKIWGTRGEKECGKLLNEIQAGGGRSIITCMALSPDEQLLVLGDVVGHITLIRTLNIEKPNSVIKKSENVSRQNNAQSIFSFCFLLVSDDNDVEIDQSSNSERQQQHPLYTIVIGMGQGRIASYRIDSITLDMIPISDINVDQPSNIMSIAVFYDLSRSVVATTTTTATSITTSKPSPQIKLAINTSSNSILILDYYSNLKIIERIGIPFRRRRSEVSQSPLLCWIDENTLCRFSQDKQDSSIVIFDIKTGSELRTIELIEGIKQIISFDFSHDRSIIGFACSPRTLLIYSFPEFNFLHKFVIGAPQNERIAFSKHLPVMAVSNEVSGIKSIVLWGFQ